MALELPPPKITQKLKHGRDPFDGFTTSLAMKATRGKLYLDLRVMRYNKITFIDPARKQ
jgi:hypothetical protein